MSIRSLWRLPISATGLDVFDKTLQTTHIWLDELMAEIGSDRQTAWHVLGAVLRAVRDRIPLELAVHLGSQLPLLVRGLYYDQWHAPGRMDEKPRSLDAFLEPIREQLAQIRPIDAGTATGPCSGPVAACEPGADREGQARAPRRSAGHLD